MDEYIEDRTFTDKLEDLAEPCLRFLAYAIFMLGIFFSLIFAREAAQPYDRYSEYNYGYGIFVFIIGVVISSILWCGIIYFIRIGKNIRRMRELMEHNTETK